VCDCVCVLVLVDHYKNWFLFVLGGCVLVKGE